ncbi:unnamed protein product [Owenia fusiformis]|nr:unnamed protein product [Owenia fusiformis]
MAINSDETIAYVSLQENNAIAVLNISANAIEGIHGLGRKDWSKSRFDASDKDGGINMQPWAVYGLYQPDNIRLMQFKGEDYIVTANEGDKKSYKMDDDGIDWSESTRAKKIAKDLDGSRGEAFREAMTDDKKLGRLTVSSIDGKNGTNKYKDIYTYGGRSFSIFKMVDLSLIYDSDDNIEQQHANSSLYGRLFNCDNYEASKTPVETFDKRSDNAGPDTESAEVATVGDTVYIFIGNERTSSIMIYSVSGDSIEPKFEGIHRAGGQETKYDMLYSQRNTGDLDPEGLKFVQASESPNGKPLLLVVGSQSSTLSVYEVEFFSSVPTSPPTCPPLGDRSTPTSRSSCLNQLNLILMVSMVATLTFSFVGK